MDIQSGIPTRINEFFYLDNQEVKNRSIENCYLFPVVKSTRRRSRSCYQLTKSTLCCSYVTSTKSP